MLPIPTFTLSRTINGVNTDLVVQTYTDKVVVMVTRVGRVGPWVSSNVQRSF